MGLFPQSIIASIVSTKLKAWVITSSSLVIPTAFKAHFNPAVPDDKAILYFELK